MHQRIDQLLQKRNNDIGVQYILSSFKEELNPTNKYLIAACLADKSAVMHLFSDWFEKGKVLKDDYFREMNLDIETPQVEAEFQRHETWRKESRIRGTPTVLVNGYQLPERYKIEDIENLIEFNVIIK